MVLFYFPNCIAVILTDRLRRQAAGSVADQNLIKRLKETINLAQPFRNVGVLDHIAGNNIIMSFLDISGLHAHLNGHGFADIAHEEVEQGLRIMVKSRNLLFELILVDDGAGGRLRGCGGSHAPRPVDQSHLAEYLILADDGYDFSLIHVATVAIKKPRVSGAGCYADSALAYGYVSSDQEYFGRTGGTSSAPPAVKGFSPSSHTRASGIFPTNDMIRRPFSTSTPGRLMM